MPSAPHNGDTRDKNILRPMVGQLCDIKEVCGQTAHELSGAVAVIVVKGQLLHMAEQVSADIRLHQDAKGMPPVADYIRQHRPQQKAVNTTAITAKKVP